MSFKLKALIWLVTLAAIFAFRYEIAGHFNLEHLLKEGNRGQISEELQGLGRRPSAAQAVALPEVGFIASYSPIYREKGRGGTVAQGKPGDQVTVLDVTDSGQRYIAIRYNGISGYISRGDIHFKINEEGQTQ